VSGSDGLHAGTYRYLAHHHGLETIADSCFRAQFAAAAFDQAWTAGSAVIFVVAAAHRRTMSKYGERCRCHLAIEAGHAAQNIFPQAVSLDLCATQVGAFSDDAVAASQLRRRDHLPFEWSAPRHLLGFGSPAR
jgi:SagB-type dehydrogenase family enzyme